jgi:putative hydrolase of the HAD superfamily
MNRLKAVIFDVYDTLLHIDIDETNIETYTFLSSWLSYHGFQISPENMLAQYKALCHEEMIANQETYPDIDIGKVFSRMLTNIKKLDVNETMYFARKLSLLSTVRRGPRVSTRG